MLVCSDERGVTQLFDAGSRTVMRRPSTSDAAKLLPDAAPPHLRDDFTIQQLQRLAEAFAANEVAGYQRQ